MEVGFNLNEDNQIIIWFVDSVNGEYRLEITDETFALIQQGKSFKYENNELILDSEKETLIANENKIIELNDKIRDLNSDMTVIMAKQITGETLTQEDQDTINLVKEYRNQINSLKE